MKPTKSKNSQKEKPYIVELLTTMAYKTTKVSAKSKTKPPQPNKPNRVSYTDSKGLKRTFIDYSFEGSEASIHWRLFDPKNDEVKSGLLITFSDNKAHITSYQSDSNSFKLPESKKISLPLKKLYSLIVAGKLK
jgi:hypothetical protein